MDTNFLLKQVGINFTRVFSIAGTLAGLNYLKNSLVQSGNANAEMLVTAISGAGMLGGVYAQSMPSVQSNEYMLATAEGFTAGCGFKVLNDVVNHGSGVQKNADGTPKIDPTTGQPVITNKRVEYGLGGAAISTMANYGMGLPNATDVEDANPAYMNAMSGGQPMYLQAI